jgi:fluoroacetyl-CoA thioesterase
MDKITEGLHERVIILPEKFNARLAEKKLKAAIR